MQTVIDYAGIVPFLVALMVLLLVYKFVHDRLTPFDDYNEMRTGNVAAMLSRAGAYLGVAVASSGSLINSANPYWQDFGIFMLDGVVAIVVFTLATRLFDAVILPKTKNNDEIEDGNVAVGLVEACSYGGLGAILCASFAGDGAGLVEGLLSAAAFSGLGMATLVVAYWAMDRWMNWRWRCDLDDELQARSMAPAIDIGTLMLAMSVTIAFSIAGPFTGWSSDIRSYAQAALAGVITVFIARCLSETLVSRQLKGRRGRYNTAQVTIVGMVTVAAGFTTGLAIIS